MTDEQLITIIKKHLLFKYSENIILYDEPSTFTPILYAMREAVEMGGKDFYIWCLKNQEFMGNWIGEIRYDELYVEIIWNKYKESLNP